MNHLGLAHYRFYLPLLACLLVFSTSLRAEIAIIVNPSNPLDTLSTHEVKKIFLGRARLFPGTDQAIAVLDQSRDNDIYKVFYTDVVGFGLNKLKRYRAAYLFSGKGKLPETVTNHEATKKRCLGMRAPLVTLMLDWSMTPSRWSMSGRPNRRVLTEWHLEC